MHKRHDWNRLRIQSLIVGKINNLRTRANGLLERGQTFKGNQTLQIVAEWERVLDLYNAAEIRWPESGGEGS